MYPFFPNTLMAAPKAVLQVVSPLQSNRKIVLEIQKKLRRPGWFPPHYTMLTNGSTCPSNTGALQTNKGHFKLINNNTLYFKFSVLSCFSQRTSRNITNVEQSEYSFHNSKGEPRNQHPLLLIS